MITQSALLGTLTNLRHGFTNLRVPKAEVEAQNRRTATAKQVHKADLIWVNALEQRAREADAIATFTPNLPVGVYSADCTPILTAAIEASTNKVYGIMAAHGGWRSTALRIAHQSFREFAAASLEKHPRSRFVAAIGPCIGPARFEVGPDVVAAFPQSEREGIAQALRVENGVPKYLFNLPAENIRQLREAALGLALEIDFLNLCTHTLADQFPSYRRDKGKDGRILSFLEFTS